MQGLGLDPGLDRMLADVVDVFTTEGVKLVRLAGLHRRCCRIAGRVVDRDVVDGMVTKLRAAGAIRWRYRTICPHCGAVVYQITARGEGADDLLRPVICEDCGQLFLPEIGRTLIDVDPGVLSAGAVVH